MRRRKQLNFDVIREQVDSGKPCGSNKSTLDFVGIEFYCCPIWLTSSR